MLRFTSEADFADLQAASEQASCPFARRVANAWHLRQRDSDRAASLAATLLQSADVELTHVCRLVLVQAEHQFLVGQLAQAGELIARARGAADECRDFAALSDASVLEASIAADVGDFGQRVQSTQRSVKEAEAAGDSTRALFGQLTLASLDAYEDPGRALTEHRQLVERHVDDNRAGLAMMAQHIFFAHALLSADRPSEMIEHGVSAWRRAVEIGQFRHAMLEATNTACTYLELDDNESALANRNPS